MTSFNLLIATTPPGVVFLLGMSAGLMVAGWIVLLIRVSRRRPS